jgi:hypothetical protein
LADITNEGDPKPLKIKFKKKPYVIQSGESNIPVVTNKNIELLQPRVDICFGTNTAHATPDLLKIYQDIQQKHRRRMRLASITGARKLFDKLISLNKNTFPGDIAAAKCHASKFNRFIKFPMVEFGVNVLGISSMPLNDERTMFVEVVVQLWKFFNNITGLLSFRWYVLSLLILYTENILKTSSN